MPRNHVWALPKAHVEGTKDVNSVPNHSTHVSSHYYLIHMSEKPSYKAAVLEFVQFSDVFCIIHDYWIQPLEYLYNIISVLICQAIIGAANIERRLSTSTRVLYTIIEDISTSFLPWLVLASIYYPAMWISQFCLTAQYYWTHWFLIWIRHGRTTSEIFQNPTRRNIKPKRLRPSYKKLARS